MPLSNHSCVYVHLCVCVCAVVVNTRLIGESYGCLFSFIYGRYRYICKVNRSFLCYLIGLSPASRHWVRACIGVLTCSGCIFLFLAKNHAFFSQISTRSFQVNQNLTNSLDCWNCTTVPCNLHDVFMTHSFIHYYYFLIAALDFI